MQCMVASSIPCKLSLCADRAHACAGDSYVSSAIDVACPTTQSVFAIASPHESPEDSWPSSSTGTRSFCCNHQYSVTAITTSTGAIAERYAYSAYGQPTILDASASVLNSSAINNRYTYTAREWDATLALHHFRARWMSPTAGRFFSRDPIRFNGSRWNLYAYISSSPQNFVDPMGWELTMIPSDIRNHPYTNKPLPRNRMGETFCDFSVSCDCTTDYKWIGGCFFGLPWQDGYHCELQYKLTTTIFMDDKKIGGRGPTWDGWFGHELIHAMNCRRKARALSPQLNGHFNSKKDCNLFAINIETDFRIWYIGETSHSNPESPLPYDRYPIDYDLDNYDLPFIPFPLPLP